MGRLVGSGVAVGWVRQSKVRQLAICCHKHGKSRLESAGHGKAGTHKAPRLGIIHKAYRKPQKPSSNPPSKPGSNPGLTRTPTGAAR